MFKALDHIHKDFGYLVFALLVLQFLIVLSGGAKKPGLRRALDLIQTVSVRIGGPVIILAGFYLWHKGLYPLATWWLWAGFLLWGPMEIVGKRMVRPALEASDSEGKSAKLLLGASLQLLIILAIFWLMTANAA
jgi:hypothetical protein